MHKHIDSPNGQDSDDLEFDLSLFSLDAYGRYELSDDELLDDIAGAHTNTSCGNFGCSNLGCSNT